MLIQVFIWNHKSSIVFDLEFVLKELGVTTVKGREAEVELFAVLGVR